MNVKFLMIAILIILGLRQAEAQTDGETYLTNASGSDWKVCVCPFLSEDATGCDSNVYYTGLFQRKILGWNPNVAISGSPFSGIFEITYAERSARAKSLTANFESRSTMTVATDAKKDSFEVVGQTKKVTSYILASRWLYKLASEFSKDEGKLLFINYIKKCANTNLIGNNLSTDVFCLKASSKIISDNLIGNTVIRPDIGNDIALRKANECQADLEFDSSKEFPAPYKDFVSGYILAPCIDSKKCNPGVLSFRNILPQTP